MLAVASDSPRISVLNTSKLWFWGQPSTQCKKYSALGLSFKLEEQGGEKINFNIGEQFTSWRCNSEA